jgi:hypothetical protein
MSSLTLRNALIQGVQSAIPGTSIAYENAEFNPNQLSAFVAVFYMPATVEALGKQKPSSDDWRGVFQVSIFVKLNAIDYDNQQLQIADDLKSTFFVGAKVGGVFIESAVLNDGGTEDGWFKRDLSINYISYQTR